VRASTALQAALAAYQPKTEPWPKQAEVLSDYIDRTICALFMEQRTGKSKVIIDKTAILYEQGLCDALLVVAMPSGVPFNWVDAEIPDHLPDRIPRMTYVWRAKTCEQVGEMAKQKELLAFKGLAILTVNGEAIITKGFRKFGDKFLKARKAVHAVGDETSLIMKKVGTKRFRVMDSIGKKYPSVKFKTILDGTPSEHGPFDFFSQIGWLSRSVFGFQTFTEFKQHYAAWEIGGTNKTTGELFKVQQRDPITNELIFCNMEEFKQKLDSISIRVLRKEMFDIPDKTYETVAFDLSPEQVRVYADLAEEYEAELHTGEKVTANMVLTRYTRLQQVASNYWPERAAWIVCPECEGEGCEHCDDLGAIEKTIPARAIDPKINPRLEALRELVTKHGREVPYKTNGHWQPGPIRPLIIWARFQQDVTDCIELLQSMGRKPVRYDGRCDDQTKRHNKALFASGEATDFVGSPAAGGRGLKIIAPTHIYYSNSFSLLARLQSEDRSEVNDKRTVGTHIIDLIANNTLDDQKIHPALRSKKRIADYILSDTSKGWI